MTERFTAHRLIRAATKTCACHDIGADGLGLIALIAHQWDAIRYREPVSFYIVTLMNLLGISNKQTYYRIEAKCIKAGWLKKQGQGTRRPSLYTVHIPEHAEVEDMPTVDESVTNNGPNNAPNNGTNHHTNNGPNDNTNGPIRYTGVTNLLPICDQSRDQSVTPLSLSPIPRDPGEGETAPPPIPSRPIPATEDLFTIEGSGQPVPAASAKNIDAQEAGYWERDLKRAGADVKPWHRDVWPGVAQRLGGWPIVLATIATMEIDDRSDPAKVEKAGMAVASARLRASAKADRSRDDLAKAEDSARKEREARGPYLAIQRHIKAMDDHERGDLIAGAPASVEPILRALLRNTGIPKQTASAVYMLRKIPALDAIANAASNPEKQTA